QAMRGFDLIAAVGIVVETGDLSRFQNPRELMGYLGVVEDTTGDRVERGHITKTANGRARRILVEAAWAYRYPARVGREKQAKLAAAPRRPGDRMEGANPVVRTLPHSPAQARGQRSSPWQSPAS